jgi:hypothetical protein
MTNEELAFELKKIIRKETFRARFSPTIEDKQWDEPKLPKALEWVKKHMQSMPCFLAAIDFKDKNTVTLGYNPRFEQERPGKTLMVLRDILRHEINHKGYCGFHGCPRNVDMHTRLIIEPIMEVLKPKGYNEQDFHFIANALEDTILHADLHSEFALEGIAEFFGDVGRHLPPKPVARKGSRKSVKRRYTQLYDAHVRLNMFLWGSRQQKKLVVKHYLKHSENEIIKKVICSFLKRTGISSLKQEVLLHVPPKKDKPKKDAQKDKPAKKGKQKLEKKLVAEIKSVKVNDKQAIRAFLNDESNWPLIARVYAEEFSKLMNKDYALPLPNMSGQGTSSGKKDKSEKSDDSGEDEEKKDENDEDQDGSNAGDEDEEDEGKESKGPSEGNQFDKEMYENEYKTERVMEGVEAGAPGPSWISHFECKDLVYQALAKRLNITADTASRRSAMPVYWYGKRPFDPSRDKLKHATLGFDDKGRIQIEKKKWHEDIQVEYKVHPKGVPDHVAGLIDTSGSMGWGGYDGDRGIIPWGTDCRYHYALLAWYGVLEWLRQNHVLKSTQISLGNFGDKTLIGVGLQEAKNAALRPQWGGTSIDMAQVRKIFVGGNRMLLFTITDGEVYNWDNIQEEFIELVKDHFFFHLQICGDSKMSNDLKEAGLYVEQVENAEDLAKLIIDFTERSFRRT